MLSDRERRLARLAVDKGYLTGNQLSDCFEHLRNGSVGLEQYLADRGYLTLDELVELRAEADRPPPLRPPLFAEIVRQRGFATDAQVEDALRTKNQLAGSNIHRYVGEILVERQILSASQVSQILEQQGKVHLQCTACGYRFNALHGTGYACPECDRPIGSTPPTGLSAPGCVGAYRLGDEVGRGPAGTVYRAVHQKNGREVALKRIPAGPLIRTVRDTFLFQTRRMMAVRHPNVAGILEAGLHGDEIIIVSDFVEGLPLHDHVVGNVRLPLEEAIGILKQVAAGLGGAAARGIVHGNLKAHNVILNELREVRLTDFGLALGESGELVHYASPERSRHGATPPGDLYACGILFYFMLAGAPPHSGSPEEIRNARVSTLPVPLSRRVPELPSAVDAIFSKLTYKEPTLRYRTGAALLADLDHLENGHVTQAERELGSRTSRA